MPDRNFDDIAEKFSRNIYGGTKGRLRQAILWQDLQQLLTQLLAPAPASAPLSTPLSAPLSTPLSTPLPIQQQNRCLHILDAGGGAGQTAIKLAQSGHQVTLCDISAEMLRRARQSASEQGVAEKIHFVQCAAQQVAAHLPAPVDLILCHAVLEWVEQPQQLLTALWQLLAAGGGLSLMFYNLQGLLMHNMVAGNFAHVAGGMPRRKKRSLSPPYPLLPAQVYGWLQQAGWQILSKTGVRVFHDYLRDKRQQQLDFAALLELESRFCRQEPYLHLGRYLHVCALKPVKSHKRGDNRGI